MKRPLFVIGLAYFITTWLAFLCPDNTAFMLSAAAALSAALCFILRKRFGFTQTLCVVFLSAAAAFAGFYLYSGARLAPVSALAGKTAVIEGLVTGVDSGAASVTYTIKASFPAITGVLDGTTIILRNAGEGLGISSGDCIRCEVRLEPVPQGSSWYDSRGVLLVAYNASEVKRIPENKHLLESRLLKLRETFALNVNIKLSAQNAAIVSAMVLGAKNDIAPEVYAAVSRSGTAHLLAVSGLHLSIISAFVLALLKKLRCPQRAAALAAIAVSFVFTGIVGFGASVLRSFFMTAIALFGRVVYRKSDSLSSLGAALLVLSIARPYWTLGFGLWLSAGSTLGIILFGSSWANVLFERFRRGNIIADKFIKIAAGGAAISVGAYTFTLPVLLVMSGWISIISPLANILVAPFVPVVILGGIFCALVPSTAAPVMIVARVTDICASFVVKISEVLGNLPFAVAALDESWLLILLAGACVLTVALLLYRANKKLIGYAALLLSICFALGELSFALAARNTIELVAFTEKNAAVLIRGREAVILGTPDMYEISNLIKYLNFRGVRDIPVIIAADSGDRVGSGMLRLAETYGVDCVIAPNDAFIAERLAEAMPQSIVYSGGYATITALGGAEISLSLQSTDITVKIGKSEIVKIRGEYGIIEPVTGRIGVYDGGIMLLPRSTPPAFEPVGAYLFGESRVPIKTN